MIGVWGASRAIPTVAWDGVVDLRQTNGVFRPLHGVNGGPLCYRGTVDLSAYHREIGVPFTRLHDVVWVNADAVDVHTVFPDFRDDPADPANYDFRATDDYVAAVLSTGSQVIYRLGESIEHTARKYRVHPPADPERWAAICAGIVAHYNEGWAGGFRHGIRYWEIWNEPDVRPAMWTGSDEEFFRLYEVTARTLKSKFPAIRVGGPGVGNAGAFEDTTFRPAPFVQRFLAFCRERRVPLDFLSWHRYAADPWDLAQRATAVRRLLDEGGFSSTESHLNEWNFLPGDDWGPMLRDGQGAARERWFAEIQGPAGAAFAATVLILLQDRPVDVAAYFTGEIQGFGLFDFHGTPRLTFQAFRAFRALLETPQRVAVPEPEPGNPVLAAGVSSDLRRATILVVLPVAPGPAGPRVPKAGPIRLTLRGLPAGATGRWVMNAIDGGHDARAVGQGPWTAAEPILEGSLRGPGILWITVTW